MKNLFVLLLGATLLSCQKEDLVESGDHPQTWQLVKMTGSLPVSVRTGAELPWQETYTFQADSTFAKRRQNGDQVTEASGKYTIQKLADGSQVKLTYVTRNSLINSCTPDSKETLILRTEDNTLVSSSEACDGPRLEYREVK
jgi:hypothetical protein